jgi:hypothetical protein
MPRIKNRKDWWENLKERGRMQDIVVDDGKILEQNLT